jgi:FdhE protein
MPYIHLPPTAREELETTADQRWNAVLAARPELGPAVALQRRLLALVLDLKQTLEGSAVPRLSLPPKYITAKLARGVPALAGEPIPLPIPILTGAVLGFCSELSAGGGGAVADHIATAIKNRSLDVGSLLSASLSRDQDAIRTGAAHRGLAPDLVWLVGELAVGPFAYRLLQAFFGDSIAAALDQWNHGYCPACGSWPAMAEVVSGHRTLRCSFCASAWELTTYACIYCTEGGEPFVTAAPDEERKDRRVEVCSGCGGYLKTVDVEKLSAFPLLSIGDLETMDLDVAAMEHGYARPTMKEFAKPARR